MNKEKYMHNAVRAVCAVICIGSGVLHADWRSATSEKMRSSKEYVQRKQQEIINKAHAAGQSVKEYVATHQAEVAAAGALVLAGLAAYAAHEINEWRKRDEIDLRGDLERYNMQQGAAPSDSVSEDDVPQLVENVVNALARGEAVDSMRKMIVVDQLRGDLMLERAVAAKRQQIEAANETEGAQQ